MSEDSKWASFVKAHRLSKSLNQGEFAHVMGVSQQTVSRWESGAQTPDTSIQEKLRQQLRVTALNSVAFWKYRVTASQAYDLLVSRDVIVLAASKHAAKLLAGEGRQIEGSRLTELLPHQEMNGERPDGLNSIDQFRDIGFFDGLIRSIRLKMEWHMPQGSCLCTTDVWPILTSEQTIVGHFSGWPIPTQADAMGWRGVRVHGVDVRLNKDE